MYYGLRTMLKYVCKMEHPVYIKCHIIYLPMPSSALRNGSFGIIIHLKL